MWVMQYPGEVGGLACGIHHKFLRAVSLKIQIFWDIMLWQLVNWLVNM